MAITELQIPTTVPMGEDTLMQKKISFRQINVLSYEGCSAHSNICVCPHDLQNTAIAFSKSVVSLRKAPRLKGE